MTMIEQTLSNEMIADGVGLHIDSVQDSKDQISDKAWVRLRAWLSTEHEQLSQFQYMRGIYLTCISEADQVAINQNFLKDRILFSGDIKIIQIGEDKFHFMDVQFELSTELNTPLDSGCHYLQASAFHYLSKTIKICLA